MLRTQIQLSFEQARAIKALSAKRGVSVAALMREAAQRLIEDEERQGRFRRAIDVAGKHSSGLGDVADQHDHYLEEAFRD